MKIKRRLVAVSVLIGMAAIPAVSFASPPRPGPYMSVFLGASAPEDSTATVSEFNPVNASNDARVQFDPGVNIGGTAGYDFGFFRLEGEMSYKQGEIATVTYQPLPRYVNTDGHLGAFAMMLNGFFDLHNESPVTPYLGGGMGFATLFLSDVRGVDTNSGALNNHIFRSDDDNVFAYQAGAGIEVALNRRLSLDLGYRYFGTSRASFTKDWPNSTDLKLASHNAAVGLRLKF